MIQNIKSLSIEELAQVIIKYPWFGCARKELCFRMIKIGGNNWGKRDFSDAALYVGSRKIIADIYKMNTVNDYSDANVQELVRAYINDKTSGMTGTDAISKEESRYQRRKVRVSGGDYFSQSDYDKVREEDDKIFSSFAKSLKDKDIETFSGKDDFSAFCTETLAKIYFEQGYFEEAKSIYSNLLLNFPEKNTYFAGIIDKLDELIKN